MIALDPAVLETVAELWRRQRRTIEARFEGASMWPTIEPGGAVRIACDGIFEVGDIVLFTFEGRVVLHRVLEKMAADRIWTIGDANRVPDFPVPASKVIGRVIAVEQEGDWRVPARLTARNTLAVALTRRAFARSERQGVRTVSLLWSLHALRARARAAWRRVERVFAGGDREKDQCPSARATSTPNGAPPSN